MNLFSYRSQTLIREYFGVQETLVSRSMICLQVELLIGQVYRNNLLKINITKIFSQFFFLRNVTSQHLSF